MYPRRTGSTPPGHGSSPARRASTEGPHVRSGRAVQTALAQLVAHPAQHPAEEARDLGLGDADLLPDLLLGALGEEAHLDHPELAPAEPFHDRRQDDPGLGGVQSLVLAAEPVGQRPTLVGARLLERRRAEAAVGGERLHDLGHRLVHRVRQLVGRGRTSELARELALDGPGPGLQLLHTSWWTDHPPHVAEVTAHLAADGGYGVRQEVVPEGRLV